MPLPSIQSYSEHDKPYSYAVYFDGADGKRLRRKFLTRKAARDFQIDKEVEYENLGRTIAVTINEDFKRDAHKASQLLEGFDNATLEAAAEHYRRHLLATSRSGRISDLVEEFINTKKQLGRTAHHVSDLQSRLRRFADKFGQQYATEVRTPEIEDWLLGLPGISNATKNHYRSKLGSFFAWCLRKGRCAVNPVAAIDRVDQPPTVCEIYSSRELKTILAAAVAWKPTKIKPIGRRGRNRLEFDHNTADVLANLVICAFAGLRQSEFCRLTWEMVKLDRGVIDLPPEITKMKRRRMITIHPTLSSWLMEKFPHRAGTIVRPNFSNRLTALKRHLQARHGIEWRHNGLRHSFASHLLESTRNPGHVAMELGHRGDVGVLWNHYAERVDKEDAAAYWSLTPDATAALNGSVLSVPLRTTAA